MKRVLLSLAIAGTIALGFIKPASADGTIDTLLNGTALAGTEIIPMFQGNNPATGTTPSAISTYLQTLGVYTVKSGTVATGDMAIFGTGTALKDSVNYGTVNGGMSFSGGGTPAFGSCYFNDIQTCVTENARLRERLFVGNAVLMNDTSATGPNSTFLSSALIGPNWIARGAQNLTMSDVGGISVAGISEIANLLGGQTTAGGAFACQNNGAGAGTCWGTYTEGQFNPGTTTGSSTLAAEVDCKNASSANNASDPFSSPPGCEGLWLAAGGGGGYGPGVITNGTTSTSQNVINVASVPAFVTAGQSIYDSTTSTQIGIVASTGSTTITMVGNALGAVGNGDYLNITFPSDAAFSVLKNLNTWRVGLNFKSGGLTADGNGNFNAIQMPLQYSQYWYSGASTIADIIRGDATNGLYYQGSGSTNDQTWANKNTTVIAQIPTGTSNFNIAPVGSAAAPSLTVGNATTGFHSISTTGFAMDVNGVTEFDFGIHAGSRLTATASMESANAAGWILPSSPASSTAPTLVPNQASTTTGFGAQASGNISAIVAGAEVQRWITGGTSVVGNITAGTLDTAGTVAGSLCATSAGLFEYKVGVNCFAGVSLSGTNTWSGTQTFGSVVGTINTQTGTTYTLAATDCGKTVLITNASAITLTTLNSIPAGCSISVEQGGAGQITVANGSGATLTSAHSYSHTFNAAGAIIGLFVDTNTGTNAHFVLTGDGA